MVCLWPSEWKEKLFASLVAELMVLYSVVVEVIEIAFV